MHNSIKIPFSRPTLDGKELEAVKQVLESGWLTTGDHALLFEKEFSQFLNTQPKHAIPVSNVESDNEKKQELHQTMQSLSVQSATAGLHLAYKALGAGEECDVISSPINFISSITPALYCGADITFIDTAPNSIYPNVESLKKVRRKGKRSILVLVPIAGYHPHYIELIEYARANNIAILEDVAHAFPAYVSNNTTEYASYDKKYYGTFGDIGVFSFYANKTITTGEGGMIVSRNQDYITYMSLLRNHGMNKFTWDRHTSKPEQTLYDIVELGYKYNMPDILAAIGRVQITKIGSMHEKRIALANRYFEKLRDKDYFILPERSSAPFGHAWHLFILQIIHPRLHRNVFMNKLYEKGIASSVHYTSLHNMTYLKNKYAYKATDFPNANEVSNRVLSLPLFPDLKESDVDYICDILCDIGDHN